MGTIESSELENVNCLTPAPPSRARSNYEIQHCLSKRPPPRKLFYRQPTLHGEDDEDKNILLSVYSSQHPQGLVSVIIPTLKVEKVRPGDSKPFVQDAGSIISRREGVNRANATQGLSSQRQHRTAWDNRDGKIHKPQPGSQNPAPSRRRTDTVNKPGRIQ